MEIDMRITRDLLIKLAREMVDKRFKPDPNVIAVFLIGSVLRDEPLLGGATDIDLLVITRDETSFAREIVKLSPEIHLDIVSEQESQYAKPRELRGDPWRGWTMWDPLLLHEKTKFFEYTQSSLRAHFEGPANLLTRARSFATPARQAWTSAQLGAQLSLPEYLDALENAANALAVLTGFPLAERRFLLEFPQRAELAGHPELADTLLALVGGLTLDPETARAWLPIWEAAYLKASQAPHDLRIHATRLDYYKQAILALLESPLPAASLWPLIRTWSSCAESGNLDDTQLDAWQGVLNTLGLDAPGIAQRLPGLDRFLDTLEESLDNLSAEVDVL
jgi:predicted nucleotidyltransferase